MTSHKPISSRVYVDRSPIHSLGVFASRPIRKGEIVLAIDDSRVVDMAHPLHSEAGEYDYHCDYLADGLVVLMRFPERHINHSCNPNTFVRTVLAVRYVFALRDIPADGEITYDYRINGFGSVVWECRCGAERCLHTLHSNFFHLPEALQAEYLPLLDDWYVKAYRLQVEELIQKLLLQ